ncbi:MAG: saccharopine dehydrogenase NADP-binding domain-containing protein [Candidatus Marinimicrobia bacterium]|nr:saccharopine dehydrogenase NADP-binding domain-containing protein [Candidatus Neomarinimicrobiota bacterium]
MKILLLGIGMQGKAALHDLVNTSEVSHIITADQNIELLEAYVSDCGYGDKVSCKVLDASDKANLEGLFAEKPDVVIDLLPVPFMDDVAITAVKYSCHLVNAFYTSPTIRALSDEARNKNITILPEFGMDPGIDLVLLGGVLRHFDEVSVIKSYGGGMPEPEAIDNPIKYKVTWTFEGVLRAYHRTAYLIQSGELNEIKDTDIFNPENIHEMEIKGLGKLEAYPNGDASQYLSLLGIDEKDMKLMGRYALRWSGHCAFWKALVDLHLLDDKPVEIDGVFVDRKKFLAAVIEPHIQLADRERDIAIIRVEVEGKKNSKKKRRVCQVIDYRDLETGLTAMSRTVGYTASIGALLIGTGKISKRGLISPVRDVPYELFVNELKKRNIHVTDKFE